MQYRKRFSKPLLYSVTGAMTLILSVITGLMASPQTISMNKHHQSDPCEFWVSPPPVGSDLAAGTEAAPWATLDHAAAHVPDDSCTVWFTDGIYLGGNSLTERFTTTTTFKAVHPYQAVFENHGSVIELDGVRNMVFEGFELRQAGPGSEQFVIIADRRNEIWSEYVTFRNNIIHDSYNNDLLKIHNGVRFFTIEGNVFYNQAASEQHMDVNSVTDVVIQDNIFFNDFTGSGRPNNRDTKHFIVVKDSGVSDNGLDGSERITIRRNIFLQWEGGLETFVKIGNDGKPYHEAKDVQVENNLMIGNGSDVMVAAFGVSGAKNVTFAHNTVVGDLPTRAYAFRVDIKGENPLNENILFYNNIWADPTGTMGNEPDGLENRFSSGNVEDTVNLVLSHNLYWNGGEAIPAGTVVSPIIDDPQAVVAEPGINMDQTNVVLPRWEGASFSSGNGSIQQEFFRLAEQYGHIPNNSPAIGGAAPEFTPTEDIFGCPRTAESAIGAAEAYKHVFLPEAASQNRPDHKLLICNGRAKAPKHG